MGKPHWNKGYCTEALQAMIRYCYEQKNFKTLWADFFIENAYEYMMTGKAEGYDAVRKPNPVPENKELLIIPGASHCDLYDGGKDKVIPWDKLEVFLNENM